VVVGLPGTSAQHIGLVHDRLAKWAKKGYRWAGEASAWEIVPVPVAGKPRPVFGFDSKHWALWVGSDLQAFNKGYQMLKGLSTLKAPRSILALHEPGMSKKGLLDNLCSIGATYFGIELVILAR